MKILDASLLKHISGAGNITITQIIPTDGVSNVCIAGLVQAFQNSNNFALTDEQLEIQILTSCSFIELDLIGNQLDIIAPSKVEFI